MATACFSADLYPRIDSPYFVYCLKMVQSDAHAFARHPAEESAGEASEEAGYSSDSSYGTHPAEALIIAKARRRDLMESQAAASSPVAPSSPGCKARKNAHKAN